MIQGIARVSILNSDCNVDHALIVIGHRGAWWSLHTCGLDQAAIRGALRIETHVSPLYAPENEWDLDSAGLENLC